VNIFGVRNLWVFVTYFSMDACYLTTAYVCYVKMKSIADLIYFSNLMETQRRLVFPLLPQAYY
jgi:hypothetical protein